MVTQKSVKALVEKDVKQASIINISSILAKVMNEGMA